MLQHLRKIRISARLNLILALVIVSFGILVWMESRTMTDALLTNKQNIPKSVVELAIGIAEHHHKQVQAGQVSEENAKQQALAQIKSLRYSGSEYLWVNDMNQVVLMHPIKPQLDGKDLTDLQDPNGKYLFREFVTVVKNDGEGFVDYLWPKPGSEDPVPKISFVKGFQPWGWVIGSGLYIDDVHATIRSLVIGDLASITIFALVIFGALYLVNISITHPLKQTIERMKDIASGGGDLTQQLPEEGDDDIRELATHFNAFMEKLKTMLGNINASIEQLSTSASALSDAANSSVHCADEQQSETDQAASAVSELSASADEIARNAEQASESSQEATKETQNGLGVVEASARNISELAQTMNSSRDTINELKQETENIGSLLTVIQGIAEQTNLLALNAAIEAARAGEQGRGFAVVADEVRTLAGKTQQATEEIDHMISKLQQGATSAVDAMEISTSKTEESTRLAEDAKVALNAISDAINRINEMNYQIATASEEQSQVSANIHSSVTNIVSSTQQNASNIRQVQESSTGIESVRSNLQELVGQFKL